MKRKVIAQKYAEVIEALYEEAAKLWTEVEANWIVFSAQHASMTNLKAYD